MFVGLLTSIINDSKHTKCVSLSNQKCMAQPTLIKLHPNQYTINTQSISIHLWLI